jgi:type I restriction enzyme M protein
LWKDKSGRRHERAEADRFRRFAYADLIARDKFNLDIFWLKDVENLEAALDRFRKVALSLQS